MPEVKGKVKRITLNGDGTPNSAQIQIVVENASGKTSLRLGTTFFPPQLFASMAALLTGAFYKGAEVRVEYVVIVEARNITLVETV